MVDDVRGDAMRFGGVNGHWKLCGQAGFLGGVMGGAGTAIRAGDCWLSLAVCEKRFLVTLRI
ncbi:hypothetical protein BJL95_21320 [Methylomonas sp. LWB]|nr:hypothetical protein BJL95_21320 [Methylomonas sp. LWB]